MWGNIANAAANMFQSGTQYVALLSPKAREAQVAIAEANARAAEANNGKKNEAFGVDKKYITYGIIAIFLIVAIVVLTKKRA